MGHHARLSPSAAKRWMVCAAAPDREAEYPDEESEAGARGTLIHESAAGRLTGSQEVDPLAEDAEATWMIDCYEDYIQRRLQELDPCQLRVETPLDAGAYIGRTDCYGTGDALLVSPKVLEVIDLKTGGWLVEPDDPQIKIYGVGALYQYMDAQGNVPFDTVRLTIFQPRRPGDESMERYIELTPRDLFTWADSELLAAAEATDPMEDGTPPPGTPTQDACHFCKARQDCVDRLAVIGEQAAVLTGDAEGEQQALDLLYSTTGVDKLTPEQLAKLLEVKPLIEARLKDAEERALKLRMARTPIPGFKVVRGSTQRKWSEEPETMAKKLTNLKLKKKEIFEEKLRSPAQIQKLGLPVEKWEKVQKYITKEPGKLQLAPESDKREDAVPLLEFGAVETPEGATAAPAETPETEAPSWDFLN